MHYEQRHLRIRAGLAAMLAIAALATVARPARAVITDTAWSFNISERELAFRDETDTMAMMMLDCDMPYPRMFARNMPYIRLTNESDSAAISQFKMTIGDEQFHFDNGTRSGVFAELGIDSPTSLGLSSTTANDGNTLLVNFLNGGLLPGQTIHFKIDLGVDTQFKNIYYKHPDYRTVLFDMNGIEHWGGTNGVKSSDNAGISLTYAMSGMPDVSVGPFKFEDPTVDSQFINFVNGVMAPFGHANDPIKSFTIPGIAEPTIPEPSSVLLAGIAVAWASVFRARRRVGTAA